MRHLTRICFCFAVAWLAGCAPGQSRSQRLTFDADPSPAQTRMNLTQWNWTRQLATDASNGVHAIYAQLGTTDINIPADRADPVDTTQLPPGQILYKQSRDRGQTWSEPMALTAREVGVDSGAIATAGAFVYVIWRAVEANRLRVYFRSSIDGGKTWNSPLALSDNPLGVSASPPAIAASSDGSIYVVWADGRPRTVGPQTVSVKEIYLSTSSDHGATWSAARPVSTPDGFSSWTPAIAVNDRTVHVAWTDERDDIGECTQGKNPCREEEYYRRSADGGMTWGAEVRLTADPTGAPAESWAPSITAAQGAVHVSYLDKRTGAFQVYYRRSLDDGATFAPEVRIAADPMYSNAARPTLEARDSEVHLCWFGFTEFEADIYYARSLDRGATWSPYLSLTADPAASGAARIPHIAVAPDHTAHLLWYDTRHSDGNGPKIELYYGRPGD